MLIAISSERMCMLKKHQNYTMAWRATAYGTLAPYFYKCDAYLYHFLIPLWLFFFWYILPFITITTCGTVSTEHHCKEACWAVANSAVWLLIFKSPTLHCQFAKAQFLQCLHCCLLPALLYTMLIFVICCFQSLIYLTAYLPTLLPLL